jgi:hypothetical protein
LSSAEAEALSARPSPHIPLGLCVLWVIDLRSYFIGAGIPEFVVCRGCGHADKQSKKESDPKAHRVPRTGGKDMSESDPTYSLPLRASSKANVLLDDTSLALLRLLCNNDARNGGQLQHSRMLAFAQPGEQHDLPAR